MKTMQELIQETVEEVGTNCSPKEKERYQEILTKIIMQQMPPAEALGITPEVMSAIYNHAYRLYNSGNYHVAGVLFAFLVNLNSSDPKYLFGMAAADHMEKKYAEAIETYWACFALNMSNPIPLYHICDCCLKLEQPQDALYAIGLAVQLAGNEPKFAKLKQRAEMIQESLLKQAEKLRKEAGEE